MFRTFTTRFASFALFAVVACDEAERSHDDAPRTEQLMDVADDVAIVEAPLAEAERLPLDDEELSPECEDAQIVADELAPIDPAFLEAAAVSWSDSHIEFKPGVTLTVGEDGNVDAALPGNTDPTSSIWCTCAGACGSSACEKIVTATSVTCQNPQGGCSSCGGTCTIGQKPKSYGLFIF